MSVLKIRDGGVWVEVGSGGGGATDHGALTGLSDDDHAQYLLASGARSLVAPWNAAQQITVPNLVSTVATGTPPLSVASTTLVANLNADLLDGLGAAAFQAADADLSAIAALAGTGLLAHTGVGSWAERAVAVGSTKLTVTNGDGVAGNPTLDLGAVASGDLSDASNLLLADGTVGLSAPWIAGNKITATQFKSSALNPLPPFEVASGIMVAGLNVEFVGGFSASFLGKTSSGLQQFATTSSFQFSTVISDEVGTGKVVFNIQPTLTSPIIGNFVSSNHTHLDAIGGGALDAAAIATGAFADARISQSSVTQHQGSIDHGSIAGLSDDDHAQYALLAGRATGQTLQGGTGASENLVLESTSHATKGLITVPAGTNYIQGGTVQPITHPFAVPIFHLVEADDSINLGGYVAKGTSTGQVVFLGARSRGTMAAPAALLANDFMFSFRALGTTSAGAVTLNASAQFDIKADGAPTATATPGRFEWYTHDGITPVLRMTLNSAGLLRHLFASEFVGASDFASTVDIADQLALTGVGALGQLAFTGTSGGGGEGIVYTDSGGGQRYGLQFEATDKVVLSNRAANGTVDLRANTATAGVGGEVTVATVNDDSFDVNTELKMLRGKKLRLSSDVSHNAGLVASDAFGVSFLQMDSGYQARVNMQGSLFGASGLQLFPSVADHQSTFLQLMSRRIFDFGNFMRWGVSSNGHTYMREVGAAPTTGLTANVNALFYVRNDKLIVKYNDAGTNRWKYLLLTGTGTTWTHSATEPA